MLQTTDERNVCIENALDVDLNITWLQNVQSHQKIIRFNGKNNHSFDNDENNSDQKICASMERMSGNDEYPSQNFGDSLQFTNWILDSGATFDMTPEVSYFIPGLLEDTDKYIEVEDGHHATAKKKVKYA